MSNSIWTGRPVTSTEMCWLFSVLRELRVFQESGKKSGTKERSPCSRVLCQHLPRLCEGAVGVVDLFGIYLSCVP